MTMKTQMMMMIVMMNENNTLIYQLYSLYFRFFRISFIFKSISSCNFSIMDFIFSFDSSQNAIFFKGFNYLYVYNPEIYSLSSGYPSPKTKGSQHSTINYFWTDSQLPCLNTFLFLRSCKYYSNTSFIKR